MKILLAEADGAPAGQLFHLPGKKRLPDHGRENRSGRARRDRQSEWTAALVMCAPGMVQ